MKDNDGLVEVPNKYSLRKNKEQVLRVLPETSQESLSLLKSIETGIISIYPNFRKLTNFNK